MRHVARRAMGLILAFSIPACAAPEQALLERFFGASRLRDTTALESIATVIVEPLQQGIVRTFTMAGATDERLEGAAAAKDITVDAVVALPDGRTVSKRLVVTLQRPRGDGPARWVVTGVRDAAASPPVPPS